MKANKIAKIHLGGLTQKEWKELVTLDYVLTWGYTDDEKDDIKRQKELRLKRECK